jgi:hypothetical protein
VENAIKNAVDEIEEAPTEKGLGNTCKFNTRTLYVPEGELDDFIR